MRAKMGRTLGANAVAQSMQHRTQGRIGVMAVVGAEPLHDIFEPEIGFLHRLVEDVEACGHVATSSKSWPERLKRAEATALTCIKRYFGRSICFGSSRMTSVAFLSVLKPEKHGVAHLTGRSPLGELDLGDELRLHPGRVRLVRDLLRDRLLAR